MKYKLPSKPLQTGDVIVGYNRHWKSRLIAWLTDRGVYKWSHVGMVIHIGTGLYIIEALDKGVQISSVDEFFRRYSKWSVMRCSKPFDSEQLKSDAWQWLNTPYAWRQLGLALIALSWKVGRGRAAIRYFKKDAKGVICTEFIAKCYEKQGIQVKSLEGDGIYVPPQYLAPNEFIDSISFEIVDEYNFYK